MRRVMIALVMVMLAVPVRADDTTVAAVARLEGQGGYVLQGIGLVMGLNRTGDSGKDLLLARPLMAMYQNLGLPIGSVEEVKNSRAVAIVMVQCRIPESGGRFDDRFDVTVTAMHGAKSLAGGVLLASALSGPYPNAPVFALAEGSLVIESPEMPTRARIRGGAQLTRDVKRGAVGETFNLILRPAYAHHAVATEVAGKITQNIYGRTDASAAGLKPIATVLDERTIRIDIPQAERANAAAFVGDVMNTGLTVSLLGLPPTVIYNAEAGAILVAGDVEISPVAITQKDLTITTATPPRVGTAINPVVETTHWAGLAPGARPGDRAKLQDLLDALNQLKIPIADQIGILSMLEKTGKLHARLVME
ncbi:MAG: flagellar basal body P-ring protein FlgI [Phycisphaerales bacterium]